MTHDKGIYILVYKNISCMKFYVMFKMKSEICVTFLIPAAMTMTRAESECIHNQNIIIVSEQKRL